MILLLLACRAPAESPGLVISDVVVTVDPAVATMLRVSWTQSGDPDGSVTSTVRATSADVAVESAPVTGDGPHTAVLVGLPADTDATVSVLAGDVEADPVDARTGSLPAELIPPTLHLYDPDAASPEPWLLTSVDVGMQNFHGPFYTVILDRQARVVWYRETSGKRMTVFPRVAVDGTHLVVDASTYFVDGDPTLTRLTLDGARNEEIPVDGLGFAWSEGEDGSFWFDEVRSSTDYHLSHQLPDGTQERVWDCNAWLDAYTTETYACGVNEVLYDEAHGSVLWSMFGTSTVAEIDAADGTLRRWFGETPGGLAITPDDVHLKLQHSPTWTPDGTVILTTHDPDDDTAQVIREFALDDSAGTATQVGSYQNAAGYYGGMEGDVTRLENGNTLIGYGIGGVIQEIDPDANVAWELDWDGHLTGHMTLIGELGGLVGDGR